MAGKGIWKKALGLLVEFDDEPAKTADPENMPDVMAQTRQALDKLEQKPAVVSPPPQAPLSSLVPNYVSQEAVAKALNQQGNQDEPVSFDNLYSSVSQSPVSVFKVEEILNQPELQNLPKDTRAKSVAVALRVMGSSVEDIIQDAYLKDQALDQAELLQRQQSQQQKDQAEAQIQAIQKEVDEFLKVKHAEIELLREENFRCSQALQAWIEAKLKEEKRIFDILSYFVADDSANITLGENQPHA